VTNPFSSLVRREQLQSRKAEDDWVLPAMKIDPSVPSPTLVAVSAPLPPPYEA
jgi:hypothetical protein